MWKKYVLNVSKLRGTVNQKWIRQIQSTTEDSYLHNPGSEPLCYDTLGDALAKTVDKYPDRVAVKSIYENVTITYEQLLKQADSLGCALRAQGLEKGDKIGIWTHNSVSWVVTVLAAARAGLISVLINPVYEKNEISYCINKTGMKSLVVGEPLPNRDYYTVLSQLLPEIENNKAGSWKSKELPTLTSVITTGENKFEGAISYNSLITGGGSQISQYSNEVKSQDGSVILLTSGSTGNPKAVLNSNLGVVNNIHFIGKRNTFDEGHHNVCVQAPLFHALGAIVTVLSGLKHGSSLILASPTYNIDANIKALFAESCTSITGTPTMFIDMLAKVKTMGDVPSKLRMALAAGAPCSPKLIKDMQKYLKSNVKVLYGLSETVASSFQSISGDSVDLVAETVGYIQDHTEAKVVNEKGETVPFGSSGELWVRGYNNMICYYNDPEKTKKTMAEGEWLKTGDQFTISKDGYGRIVGRIKDIIVRGGENIAPKEIEDILNTHPDIIDSQVIGVADERLGEELCAVLRLKEGATFTTDDIKRHLTGRIARFKIPKIMKVVEEFPKTASGKIQKHILKKIIESGH